MAEDNVVDLHPKEKTFTADEVLDANKGVFKEVLLVGWGETGLLSIASNIDDPGEILLMMELFKKELLSRFEMD